MNYFKGKNLYFVLFIFLTVVFSVVLVLRLRFVTNSKPIPKKENLGFEVSDKFELGVEEYYIAYKKGAVDLDMIAEQYNMVPKDGRVWIHIYVVGNKSEDYTEEFKELDIVSINPSDYAPRIGAYVNGEQLELLAKQKWVKSITSPPGVALD